jgi:hypothetical protein
MTRAFWLFVFVAAIALVGAGPAQTAPAAPSVQPAAASPTGPEENAATAQAAVAEQAPTVDLFQIFGSPAAGGISTVPAPVWSACTSTGCKKPCLYQGCLAVCVNFQTCECETKCP